jgi:hypothetical protein
VTDMTNGAGSHHGGVASVRTQTVVGVVALNGEGSRAMIVGDGRGFLQLGGAV